MGLHRNNKCSIARDPTQYPGLTSDSLSIAGGGGGIIACHQCLATSLSPFPGLCRNLFLFPEGVESGPLGWLCPMGWRKNPYLTAHVCHILSWHWFLSWQCPCCLHLLEEVTHSNRWWMWWSQTDGYSRFIRTVSMETILGFTHSPIPFSPYSVEWGLPLQPQCGRKGEVLVASE